MILLLAAVPLLTLAAVVLLAVFSSHSGPPATDRAEPAGDLPPLIAVLPFTTDGPSSDSEFFANGVHNDLLTQLAKLQSLRVISATSVRGYRDVERNLRSIGEELGADVILEGSVQLATNQIRINAQLIDAHTDEHLWAESYDRELSAENLFAVQSEIANAITKAMQASLTPQDTRQLTQVPTRNMAAYKAYHQAMQLKDSNIGVVDEPEFIQLLQEAVALDPNFSRAWAELVTSLAFQNVVGDHPDKTMQAEQALQQLEDVAPGSADFLIGQAAYLYYALKDYDHAHQIISRAIEMNPSDVTAIQLRSWIERRQGDFDALVRSRREAQRIDPLNPYLTDTLLAGLLYTHRYDEAEAEVDASTLQSFRIGYVKALKRFRETRDIRALGESILELCGFYAWEDCEWEPLIAMRDYPAALEALGPPQDDPDGDPVTVAAREHLFTDWLMPDHQLPDAQIERWQQELEADRSQDGDYWHAWSFLSSALIAGLRGDREGAEESIERWHRHRPIDWAERANRRHEACRILGMIEATHATVKCIEDGLKEPSLIIPFYEPYLPFYDGLRDKPEFIQMLVEIDGETPDDPLD